MSANTSDRSGRTLCTLLLVAGALGLSVGACGQEEPPGAIAIDISGTSVEIGQGVEAWTALPSLSEVRLFRGSQGGLHMIGNFQLSTDEGSFNGGNIEGVTARFRVIKEDGEELSFVLDPFKPDFEEVRPGVVTLKTGRYIFIDGLKAVGIHGQSVVMGVEVYADGEMGADYRTVIVNDPDRGYSDPSAGDLDALLSDTAFQEF